MVAASPKEYITNYLTPCGPSDDPTCPICFADWEPEEQTIVKTHCGHTYHKDCIIEWLNFDDEEDEKTCPSCRELLYSKPDYDVPYALK
jgi:hypothetical protein